MRQDRAYPCRHIWFLLVLLAILAAVVTAGLAAAAQPSAFGSLPEVFYANPATKPRPSFCTRCACRGWRPVYSRAWVFRWRAYCCRQ